MSPVHHPQKRALRNALLAWYDQRARILPWRISPAERRGGVEADPYRIWLSEIMLQQTTTLHAAPYFLEFTRRWPSVMALAAADDGDVMSAWAGLGYYARARNLLACARVVAEQREGRFPQTTEALMALPGVGAYTAAAITAIAFDQPANVVDGNVERVMARLFAVRTPLPAAKAELNRCAEALVTDQRPGDWAQALMDLGATICTPRSPSCALCPLQGHCLARASGDPASLPVRAPKPERPHRFGVAYLSLRGDEAALVRRPAKGLLGGMLGLPTNPWGPRPIFETEAQALAPCMGSWPSVGAVEHVFTHFSLTLDVRWLDTAAEFEAAIWTPVEIAAQSLPTVFRKALLLGLKARNPLPMRAFERDAT